MSEKLEKQEEVPRSILSRLIKEELIAASSTAYNAKERQDAASKAIEELLVKYPELIDKVDEIQKNHIEILRR